MKITTTGILGLDGVAYFDQTINGVFDGVEHTRFGHVDLPKGSATLMLVADGQKVTFFINGKESSPQRKTLTSGIWPSPSCLEPIKISAPIAP